MRLRSEALVLSVAISVLGLMVIDDEKILHEDRATKGEGGLLAGPTHLTHAPSPTGHVADLGPLWAWWGVPGPCCDPSWARTGLSGASCEISMGAPAWVPAGLTPGAPQLWTTC